MRKTYPSALKHYLDENFPSLANFITLVKGNRHPLFLEYPIDVKPRFGHGSPVHTELQAIIGQNRSAYEAQLERLLQYREQLWLVPVKGKGSTEPHWLNGFLPGLDAVALYGYLSQNNPALYIEIGSGNSTKFASLAKRNNNLRTKLISIDPYPRADIDELCDEIVREPVENIDLSIFHQLQSGDILFIDNSHRTFPNSDVTVCMLEIMPRLNSGVFVHVHDIYLPFDYPQSVCNRHYSEQYLLACYLLGGAGEMEILLPNYFITKDLELSKVLNPLWEDDRMQGVERTGCSFWLRK